MQVGSDDGPSVKVGMQRRSGGEIDSWFFLGDDCDELGPRIIKTRGGMWRSGTVGLDDISQ